MNNVKYIILCLAILFSCTEDNDDILDENLDTYLNNRSFEIGAVIACAASAKDSEETLTFYYQKQGATDIRLYETDGTQIDENDFSNYSKSSIEPEPFGGQRLPTTKELKEGKKRQ